MNVSGPVFLLLYLLLAFAANVWLRRHFRGNETTGVQRKLDFAQDPYQIAYLRAGADEAIKVAVVSLVDRGLLEESNGDLLARGEDAGEFARRPIEKAILKCFSTARKPAHAAIDARVKAACLGYETELQKHRLLAGAETYRQRFTAFAAIAAAMIGISVWRIAYALAHGRSNIWFLVILTIICTIALYAAYRKRITGMGEAALERLKILFASLKRRAAEIRPGGENQDVALLAALYGLAILPEANFPFIERLYPKPVKGGSGGDGGSSSDGGGGCSGGCGGGCGGCG